MIAQIITYNAVNTGLLVAKPNWANEITVTLDLPTDVSKEPITFNESRRNFAASSRYSMKWTSYLNNVVDSVELRIFLTRIRAEPILVPLWPDVCEIVVPVTGGSTSIGLLDYPVRYGSTWVIANPDFSQYEIVWNVSLSSVVSLATITGGGTGGGTVYAWPAGTYMYPLIQGRLSDRPKPESITDESLEVEFTIQESSNFSMRVTPGTVTLATVGSHIPAFASTPLFDVAPNFSRPIDWTEMPDVVYEHIGFLREDQQRVYDHRNPRGQELEFYQSDRASAQRIVYFWRDRRANTRRFMVPTWRGDFRMQQDTPVAGNPTWIVCDYNEFGDAGREVQPGDPYIALIDANDAIDPYQLSGTTDAPASAPVVTGYTAAPYEFVSGDDGFNVTIS
jgi:hypothetical protein